MQSEKWVKELGRINADGLLVGQGEIEAWLLKSPDMTLPAVNQEIDLRLRLRPRIKLKMMGCDSCWV